MNVLNSVEYLTYKLREREVDIWADFFIENMSDEPSRLRCLHRGNIDFEVRTDTWLTDDRWTPILFRFAGNYIGLRKTGDNKLMLCRAGLDPLQVAFLKDSGRLEEWTPTRPSDGSYVPFTGWEGPVVAPKSCGLLRIAGTMKGESYDCLMEQHIKGEIEIMGGESLERDISNDLQEEGGSGKYYKDVFREFVHDYVDNPRFYHVFFELADRRSIKLLYASQDMKKKTLNEKVGDRFISWCCSDMDFNIYADANGPVLVLATDQSHAMDTA